MKFTVKQLVVFGMSLLIMFGSLVLGGAALAQAPPTPPASRSADFANTVVAGRLIIERPTLLTAGYEWGISGDANRNAKVDVMFRKKGQTAWRTALAPLRLQNEKVQDDVRASRRPTQHPPIIDYTVPNAFAGSIFNLEPNTEYEIHLVLSDPDGVACFGPQLYQSCAADKDRIVTLKTRPEPMPATGGAVYHVYPADWKGPKQEPSFIGLLAAYYMGAFDADYWNGYPARVQPGDTILMHAGVYKDTAFSYYYGHVYPVKGVPSTAYGLFFDGTYYLHANGTPEKPIVIKSAGDGEVVIDGNNAAVLFDLTKANYNYFEGITVRNATIAFLLGRKEYWGADGFTLKHSKLEDISRGVHCDWGLSKDFYIADNTFIGRTPADRLVGHGSPDRWSKDPAWPVPISGPGGSEYAVKVYGQGHVVAYNRAERFHDGFDIATYSNPTALVPEDLPRAIDFYNNDVSNVNDQCYEFDGGARNIRMFRNRCFNDANSGLSISPGFGGPFYYFQNVHYNNIGGVEGCGGECAGLVFYQNTVIGDSHSAGGSNNHFLNNLILATGPASGAQGNASQRPVFVHDTPTNYSSSDYNGFRPDPATANSFQWNSPPSNVVADFDFSHPTVERRFKTLQEYAAATGQDKHSILIDYDIFGKVAQPDANNISRLYNPADFDFRLKAGSKAIDAGAVLPTINDGFVGRAPDLGAIEFGQDPPHYGPRP